MVISLRKKYMAIIFTLVASENESNTIEKHLNSGTFASRLQQRNSTCAQCFLCKKYLRRMIFLCLAKVFSVSLLLMLVFDVLIDHLIGVSISPFKTCFNRNNTSKWTRTRELKLTAGSITALLYLVAVSRNFER